MRNSRCARVGAWRAAVLNWTPTMWRRAEREHASTHAAGSFSLVTSRTAVLAPAPRSLDLARRTPLARFARVGAWRAAVVNGTPTLWRRAEREHASTRAAGSFSLVTSRTAVLAPAPRSLDLARRTPL